MSYRKYLYLVAVLAFAVSGFKAEASEHFKTLNWHECVRKAEAGNPDLLSARASLKAAQDKAHAAISGYLPQITASLGAIRQKSASATANVVTHATDQYSAAITATQNLFTGLATLGQVKQANAAVEVAKANLKTVRAKVSYDLKAAFAGLVYAQDSVKLAEKIIAVRDRDLKNVSLRFQSGNENKGSLLLSQAYLKDARFGKLQAQDAIEVASRQLAQVVGLDTEDRLHVIGKVPIRKPPDPLKINLKRLAVFTPDHLQAVGQTDSAEAAIMVARAPFFPELGLTASAGRVDDSFFPQNGNWSIGVSLTLPLFSGGKDYFSTKAAVADFHAAALNQASVDRGLLYKLKQALSAYVEAVAKLGVDQIYVDASTVRERIGRAKYNNGLLSFEEWDIIENDFISREKALLQSQRNRVTAEAAWEQAQGKGVFAQ